MTEKTFTAPNGRKFTPDENGFISGNIRISVSDMIEWNLERFLDAISEALTGTDLLSDISYEPVGVEDGLLVLSVTGAPDLISRLRLADARSRRPASGGG